MGYVNCNATFIQFNEDYKVYNMTQVMDDDEIGRRGLANRIHNFI